VVEPPADGADASDGEMPDSPADPPADPFGLPAELAPGEEEVRRMIDAGASSPEELRALAERLREQRTQEESAWRREVRPALLESKKLRYSIGSSRESSDEERSRHGVGLAVALAAAVLVLLMVATQTSFIWLLLPIAGILVYAFLEGRKGRGEPTAPDAAPEPGD
jgi:hypothetical protein